MKLKAENISRQYLRKSKDANFFVAVQKTDFILEENQLVEITGRSGSGKSTLLNMLSGLLTPSTGKILIDGNDVYSLEDSELSVFRNSHFGIIPQGQSGLSSLTILENVMLPSLVYGEESETVRDKALSLLEKVGIAGLRDEHPQNLSGGELRRMAIARSLINDPEFIFADEPTSDLDDENTRSVLSMLQTIAREGRSVLLVTHETDAARYADKVYRMNAGVLTESI